MHEHRAWRVARAAVAIAALAQPLAAYGQSHDADAQAPFTPKLVVDEPPLLDEIVVQGRSGPEFDAGPVAIERFGFEQIQEMPVLTVGDVLAFTPGLRVQQRVQGEGAALSVEGLPPEYTKMMVNGEHYAGELGAVADLNDVPIANVESINLLRGPQTLRYGADAAGAIVDVRTRSFGDSALGFRSRSGVGEEGLLYFDQSTSFAFGSADLVLTTVHDQTDGFDSRGTEFVEFGGGEDSRERVEDVYSTLAWEIGDSTRLTGSGGWRQELDDSARSEDSDGGERDYQRWLGGARIEHWLEDTRFELSVNGFTSETTSEIGRDFLMDEDELALRGHVEHFFSVLDIAQRLRVGGDLIAPRLELNESGLDPADAAALAAANQLDELNPDLLRAQELDESFTNSGVYAEWELAFTDWARMQLGSRAVLHSAFDDKVVAQAALQLEPIPNVELQLGWGTGYRTPSLRDLHQPAVSQNGGNYFLSGNPDLRPASTKGWRAGATWRLLDQQLAISATTYVNRVEDHIRSIRGEDIVVGSDTRFDPGDPILCNAGFPEYCPGVVTFPKLASRFEKSNLDLVRSNGVEATIDWQPDANVRLYIGYTLNRTRADSPNLSTDELPNEPRHTLDFQAMAALPGLGTRFNLRGRWRDECLGERVGTGISTFVDPDFVTDRSWEIDLRVTQPVNDWLELLLDLQNLTDERSVDSYEIRGRRVVVGFRVDFQELSWD